MSKPIFIIQLPMSDDPDSHRKVTKMMEEKITDYHVIVVTTREVKKPEFKVFSDKEIEPIEIEKLKEIISS